MKKFLCIADIHGDIQGVLKAREFAATEGIENAIILGDFSGREALMDPKKNIKDVEKVLSIMSNFSLLAIPGNCDSKDTIKIFEKEGINLHRQRVDFDDTMLVGLGGSNPTPFDTPFELEEDEIYTELKSLLEGNEDKRTILALHCPPKGTECDKLGNGAHVGSEAIRKIVEEFQPSHVLCSHIHESAGRVDQIKRTKIVNLGPISTRRVGILRVGSKISLRLSKI